MKIDLSFAELHTCLFLDKRNWGTKLNIKDTTKGTIQLCYDRAEKELLVKSGNRIAIIPTSNVVSMTPITSDEAKEPSPEPAEVVMAKRSKIKAQASTPMDHVHGGLGAGKVND